MTSPVTNGSSRWWAAESGSSLRCSGCPAFHQPHLTLTEIDWGGLSVERVTAHDHPLYLGDLFTFMLRKARERVR